MSFAEDWNKSAVRARLIDEIYAERDRQDVKFGWCENPASILPGTNEHAKVSVLTEEVGEVAKAVIEVELGSDTEAHLEEELIQVCAVAFAWLEARRLRALRKSVCTTGTCSEYGDPI